MTAVPVAILPCAEELAPLRGRERVLRQSALARQALGACAESVGVALGQLDKDADDVPIPVNGWHWSLSHTSRFAAAALARAPVGVDVEEIGPRDQLVVPRVTSRAELEVLGGFDWRGFFRVWTAKEAVLKKAGVGLSELSRCRLVAVPDERTLVLHHRDRDHVVHQQVELDHVVSVAHDDPAADGIQWFRLPPNDSARARA